MLVVFIGLPGSGKTSIVEELSSILGINDRFVEPEEERWPAIAEEKEIYSNFSVITWLRSIRVPMLIKAKKKSQDDKLVLLEPYYDKILHYYIGRPGMEWLISPSNPYFNALQETSRVDGIELPEADIIIFTKIEEDDWLTFLRKRGRNLDKDEEFLKTFEVHQNYLLEAAEKLSKEKNIPLVCFQQENSSPSNSAKRLINQLKKQDNLWLEFERVLNRKQLETKIEKVNN